MLKEENGFRGGRKIKSIVHVQSPRFSLGKKIPIMKSMICGKKSHSSMSKALQDDFLRLRCFCVDFKLS